MDKLETRAELADPQPDPWLNTLLVALNLSCIAAIGWLLVSLSPEPDTEANVFAPRQMSPCVMDQDGYMRGQLYGAVQQQLDWHGENMLCDGMPRPEGRGMRLVFSQSIDPDVPGLMMVIGVADAVLGNSDPEEELEANVTIIDQTNGRFYSTQEQPRCWTRLTSQLRLTGTIEEIWRLDGSLYCASALAALVGPGSVTLGDIEYSGIMKPTLD
jgi:hypothetical protein